MATASFAQLQRVMIATGEPLPWALAGCARTAQLASMLSYLQHVFASATDDGERFHAIFLDARRGYLDDCCLAAGSSAHLAIRLRDLFARALALDAQAMIVAHNHPSGNCRPSMHDVAATQRLAAISRELGIELLDHLIVTREKVYSMRAGGRL